MRTASFTSPPRLRPSPPAFKSVVPRANEADYSPAAAGAELKPRFRGGISCPCWNYLQLSRQASIPAWLPAQRPLPRRTQWLRGLRRLGSMFMDVPVLLDLPDPLA